jgi:hypothetical protein
MENKFFMHRIKHTNGVYDKGIEVKDSFDEAKQSYHAYLGAYAYGHDANTDYVSCMITDISGTVLLPETWIKPEETPVE